MVVEICVLTSIVYLKNMVVWGWQESSKRKGLAVKPDYLSLFHMMEDEN